MTNQLNRFIESIPTNAPASGGSTAFYKRVSKVGREMAQKDQQAALQARDDFNAARVLMHRNQLAARIEKAENRVRAELAADVMNNVKTVETVVQTLASGNPHLEMMLRDMQMAYNAGEQARIFQRGMGD